MPNDDTRVVVVDGRRFGPHEVAKLKQVQRSLSNTLKQIETLLARVVEAREAT